MENRDYTFIVMECGYIKGINLPMLQTCSAKLAKLHGKFVEGEYRTRLVSCYHHRLRVNKPAFLIRRLHHVALNSIRGYGDASDTAGPNLCCKARRQLEELYHVSWGIGIHVVVRQFAVRALPEVVRGDK